jgi:ribosome-associated protein
MSPPDDDKSNRQIAKGKARRAGDRSARMSRTIMQLSEAALKKLALDQELRFVVDHARSIKALGARRREERRLAGELRRYDLQKIDEKLSKLHESENTDTELFHKAEAWRAQMIAGGVAAAAEFPGGIDEELPRLIDAAQREGTTGKPPGAARKLFRHVIEALRAQQEPPPSEDDDAEDDDDADDDADD